MTTPRFARLPFGLRFALRDLLGDPRGFGVFIACVVIGVAAISGVSGLSRALTQGLAREGRTELAKACFDFLPTRARLDLAGWEEMDIFAHA